MIMKTAVLTPIPSASVTSAMAVVTGDATSRRKACLTILNGPSCRNSTLRRRAGADFARRHFDFDLPAGIGKAGRDQGGRGPDVAEIPAEHWPARLEVLEFRQDVAHPDHVGYPAPSPPQRVFYFSRQLCR